MIIVSRFSRNRDIFLRNPSTKNGFDMIALKIAYSSTMVIIRIASDKNLVQISLKNQVKTRIADSK